MKPENFGEVKKKMADLDLYRERLKDLSLNSVGVRIENNHGIRHVMTIPLWESQDHQCKHIAKEFIETMIAYYEKKIRNLTAEIEQL